MRYSLENNHSYFSACTMPYRVLCALLEGSQNNNTHRNKDEEYSHSLAESAVNSKKARVGTRWKRPWSNWKELALLHFHRQNSMSANKA